MGHGARRRKGELRWGQHEVPSAGGSLGHRCRGGERNIKGLIPTCGCDLTRLDHEALEGKEHILFLS